MKQKNGAWLLALAAMLCSIGGVCIKGVPVDAAGHQRRAQRHCGVHHGRVFVAAGGACAGTEPWPAAR